MNSNDSTDLSDNKDKELELEQVKLRQMELELELKRMEPGAIPSGKSEQPAKLNPSSKPPAFLIFCLTFLAPIGIIWLWRLKIPIFVKIIFTVYGLAALYAIVGWMFGWYYMERWPIILAW